MTTLFFMEKNTTYKKVAVLLHQNFDMIISKTKFKIS